MNKNGILIVLVLFLVTSIAFAGYFFNQTKTQAIALEAAGENARTLKQTADENHRDKEKFARELDRLEAELKSEQNRLGALNKESAAALQAARQETQARRQEISGLTGKLSAETKTIAALKQQMASIAEEKKAAEAEADQKISTLQQQRSAREKQLAVSREHFASAQEELKRLATAQAANTETIRALKGKLSALGEVKTAAARQSDETIEGLQQQLSGLNGRLETAKERSRTFQAEIGRFEKKLAAGIQTIAELRTQLAAAAEIKAAVIADNSGRMKILQQQLVQLKTDLESARDSSRSQKAEIEQLEEALASESEVAAGFKRELASLKKEKTALAQRSSGKIDSLQQQLGELETRLAKARAQTQACRTEFGRLEDALTAESEAVAALKAQLADLSDEKKAATGEYALKIDALQNEFAKQALRLTAARDQSLICRKEMEQLETALAAGTQTITGLKTEMLALAAESAEALEQTEGTIKALRQQVTTGQARYTSAEAELARERQDSGTLREELNQAKTELQKARAGSQQIVNKNRTLAESVAAQTDTIAFLNDRIAALTSEKAAEVGQKAAENVDLKKRLGDWQTRLAATEKELQQYRRTATGLTQKLDRAQSSLGEARATIGRSAERMAELEVQLRAGAAAVANLNARIEELTQSKSAEAEKGLRAIAALQKELTELQQSNRTCEEQLSDTSVQLKAYGASKTSLDERLQETLASLEGLKRRYEDAEARLAVMTETEQELKRRLGSSEKDREELQAIHEQTLAQVKAISQTVAEREAQLASATASVQRMIEAQKRTRGRLQQTQEALQTLAIDKDTAIKRIQTLQSDIDQRGRALDNLSNRLSQTEQEKGDTQKTLTHLKETHAELMKQFESEIGSRETVIKKLQEKLSVTFVQDVLFKSGSTRITRAGRKALKTIGDVLMQHQGDTIVVAGHSDNVPPGSKIRDRFPSNWELSAARAGAVIRYFQYNVGIDPSRMEAVGHAFFKPVTANDTAGNRARNRRVEILIVPPKD